MTDPSWPSSPPEANYLRLVGPGATGTASTLANAAAWQALMVSNELAFTTSSLGAASTALGFRGLGGSASSAASARLNTSLQMLACWVQEKPPILASAVAAYEAAVSAMIPAEVSVANRMTQSAHVALNPLVLGALTPAIAALDAEYFGEHWPHNASAGATYGSVLTALVPTLAVPPPVASTGSSAASPQLASAAVTEAAGNGAVGVAVTGTEASAGAVSSPGEVFGQVLTAGTQPLQSAMQPLLGMFQTPVQALQAMAGVTPAMAGQSGGILGTTKTGVPAVVAPTGAGAYGGSASGAGGLSTPGPGGGVAGTPLTTFTRPTGSFAPQAGGRPVSPTAGLLSASETAMTTARAGAASMSPAPAPVGMLGRSKVDGGTTDSPRARVVTTHDLTATSGAATFSARGEHR